MENVFEKLLFAFLCNLKNNKFFHSKDIFQLSPPFDFMPFTNRFKSKNHARENGRIFIRIEKTNIRSQKGVR
jgi:hypothetical protein